MAPQNILIVDDKPNLLESFKIGLELKDYHTTLADRGNKALEELKEDILFDIRGPGMDGLETLQEIRKVRTDCRHAHRPGQHSKCGRGRSPKTISTSTPHLKQYICASRKRSNTAP